MLHNKYKGPVQSRAYDSMTDLERLALSMEANNAASRIADHNSGNSPEYLLQLAKALEGAANGRIARRNPQAAIAPQNRNDAPQPVNAPHNPNDLFQERKPPNFGVFRNPGSDDDNGGY